MQASKATSLKLNSLELPSSGLPLDESRPNRLCVSVSDLHFTDGTVGKQYRDDWSEFFEKIEMNCQQWKVEELHLILAGDIIDFIRTSRWAEQGVYPWDRDHSDYTKIVRSIFEGILEQHGQQGAEGFFTQLRKLKQKLDSAGQIQFEVYVLLGNHDKEILLDNDTLADFYKHCLGWDIKNIPLAYRRWLGRQYGQENRFDDLNQAPWFPFYYGDQGFRFFVTHGHFRDPDNSRALSADKSKPGWSSDDGWQLETWQKLEFAPFREACFGDTIAGGLLSTFIWKIGIQLPATTSPEITKLKEVINELDLYRPSYIAVRRIIEISKELREEFADNTITPLIDKTLIECVLRWINDPFVFASCPRKRKFFLQLARFVFRLSLRMQFNLELRILNWIMLGLEFFNKWEKSKTTNLEEFIKGAGYMNAYDPLGFQIYGEGHTHEPDEIEISARVNRPTTYINFGTWRDQIVSTVEAGYRRRSVGRALFIYDLEPTEKQKSRQFFFSVEDDLTWY